MALYARIDDELKASPWLAPWRPAVGIAPTLSDAELLTLAVMSALLGFLSVLLNFLWPDSVFLWMLNSVGAIALVIWISVAATQLRTGRRLERTAPERLAFRVWAFPGLTIASLLSMGGVPALLATDDASRRQLLATAVLTAVVVAVSLLRKHRRAGS